jgi:uncharacterized membrane protein YphA (DoxX/SURF4 family)
MSRVKRGESKEARVGVSRALKFLFGIPMVVFGFQHIIYVEFIASMIPTWIPGKYFWAYATGVALIVAGISIASRLKDRWSSLMLGCMISTWILLLHVPRILQSPANMYEWTSTLQALAISASAFVLWQNLSRRPTIALPAREHGKIDTKRSNPTFKKQIHLRRQEIKNLEA